MIAIKSSLWRKRRLPRVPDHARIYAIGDIHGRADLIEDMFKRIDAHLASNPIQYAIEVYLGDYVDRGPASRDVLDLLVARKQSRRTVFLKGNHETYITDFGANPALLEDWQRVGGLETLLSYGITPSLNADAATQLQLAAALDRIMPEHHRQFLGELKSFYICGDYFFVHAGVRPGIPLAKQKDEDLLWIRHDFLSCEDNFGKIIVHGHTPVLQPGVHSNRINIDTGAYATGRLTCLILQNDEIGFL